jgi:hypothetical protein
MSFSGNYYYDAFEIIDQAPDWKSAAQRLKEKGYSESAIQSFYRDWEAMVNPYEDDYEVY